jgi:hypothetical protein
VQNIENYLPTKIPRNARHIQFVDQIPKTFAIHVCPPVRTCLGSSLSLGFPAYSAPYPGYRNSNRTCPAPSPDMPGFLVLSRVKVRNRTCLVPQPGSREVYRTCPVLWHPKGQIPLGDKKSLSPPPHASLARLTTHFNLQTLWDTLLSSQPLSSKLHSNLSFLGEMWASLLSGPLDLQLKYFTDDLHVFVTLRNSLP